MKFGSLWRCALFAALALALPARAEGDKEFVPDPQIEQLIDRVLKGDPAEVSRVLPQLAAFGADSVKAINNRLFKEPTPAGKLRYAELISRAGLGKPGYRVTLAMSPEGAGTVTFWSDRTHLAACSAKNDLIMGKQEPYFDDEALRRNPYELVELIKHLPPTLKFMESRVEQHGRVFEAIGVLSFATFEGLAKFAESFDAGGYHMLSGMTLYDAEGQIRTLSFRKSPETDKQTCEEYMQLFHDVKWEFVLDIKTQLIQHNATRTEGSKLIWIFNCKQMLDGEAKISVSFESRGLVQRVGPTEDNALTIPPIIRPNQPVAVVAEKVITIKASTRDILDAQDNIAVQGQANIISLDGRESLPRGDEINYQWEQSGGLSLDLAPKSLARDLVQLKIYEPGEYKFKLAVSANGMTSTPNEVIVVVLPPDPSTTVKAPEPVLKPIESKPPEVLAEKPPAAPKTETQPGKKPDVAVAPPKANPGIRDAEPVAPNNFPSFEKIEPGANIEKPVAPDLNPAAPKPPEISNANPGVFTPPKPEASNANPGVFTPPNKPADGSNANPGVFTPPNKPETSNLNPGVFTPPGKPADGSNANPGVFTPPNPNKPETSSANPGIFTPPPPGKAPDTANAAPNIVTPPPASPVKPEPLRPDPNKAKDFHDTGVALMKAGKFAEAKLPLSEALVFAPGHTNYRFDLATAQMESGDLANAIDNFGQVANIEKNPRAMMNMSHCYARMNMLAEAQKCSRNAYKAGGESVLWELKWQGAQKRVKDKDYEVALPLLLEAEKAAEAAGVKDFRLARDTAVALHGQKRDIEALERLKTMQDLGYKPDSFLLDEVHRGAVEETTRKAAEKQRAIAAKLEADRIAVLKAEADRIAAQRKAEEDRIAAQKKAEADRIAALKVEADRIAAAQRAEADRIAAQKAEAERIAAKKADDERIAARKAEAERIAAQKAEAGRIAALKNAEAERKAAEEEKRRIAQVEEEKKQALRDAEKRAEEDRKLAAKIADAEKVAANDAEGPKKAPGAPKVEPKKTEPSKPVAPKKPKSAEPKIAVQKTPLPPVPATFDAAVAAGKKAYDAGLKFSTDAKASEADKAKEHSDKAQVKFEEAEAMYRGAWTMKPGDEKLTAAFQDLANQPQVGAIALVKNTQLRAKVHGLIVLDAESSVAPKGRELFCVWEQVEGEKLPIRPEDMAQKKVGLRIHKTGTFKFEFVASDGAHGGRPVTVTVEVTE